MKISLIGLGKLGAPMMAAYASRGNQVIGVDTNDKIIEELNAGHSHLKETGLNELLKKHKKQISATRDINHAVLNSDITFIIVPTPSINGGSFTNKHVLEACKNVAETLKKKNKYHLVIVSSTVMPGSSFEIVSQLEKFSGKKCGKDFGFCYNPEFIALGSIIRDLLNPDFILIGELDKKDGDILEKFYKKTVGRQVKISRMNPTNAEITKIALNSFVTMKISFANLLAEICDKIPGGNVDDVTRALGNDSRIGHKYLKGGLGFGGPCFPRDNKAFANLAANLNLPSPLALANHKFNGSLGDLLKNRILEKHIGDAPIGILGLTYKPGTDVIEESQGLLLAQNLIKHGKKVIVFDPAGMENARRQLGNTAVFASSAAECIKKSKTVILATPWKAFSKIDPLLFKKGIKPKYLLDCWRILDPIKFEKVCNFNGLGIHKI
ncbi:hypothetical protein A2Z53_02535 [Candidatus Giovannonibacteria bacterium RIFCSPHIGHO2_02_42_15]|uniref:UDP-glucose 6-dehydrogenase n=2 Tax=Candidatus Giovannoniibacteriota TaxID=1752738 RepID=A0A1F5VP01_9BACT|nr:MAG: hypothetical protein A2Z53_02535 [Candidatus Giovannonibacteria bacterium RIFCSPHIGHO2_02_42_15]